MAVLIDLSHADADAHTVGHVEARDLDPAAFDVQCDLGVTVATEIQVREHHVVRVRREQHAALHDCPTPWAAGDRDRLGGR